MLRRSSKSDTALDQTKQALAREESELRQTVEKLERMIAEAPRIAEEEARRQREELRLRAGAERTRLDVSLALDDKRYYEGDAARPRGSMRKQRREGRIIFLVLVVALAAAVIWLIAHLRAF
jgi:septal ring factor EnvC (AmiA/AmiB activator)